MGQGEGQGEGRIAADGGPLPSPLPAPGSPLPAPRSPEALDQDCSSRSARALGRGAARGRERPLPFVAAAPLAPRLARAGPVLRAPVPCGALPTSGGSETSLSSRSSSRISLPTSVLGTEGTLTVAFASENFKVGFVFRESLGPRF